MLLGIPGILRGDLLKVLSDMGHGDEVAIVDANFPAERRARRLVRDMGSSSVDMLAAVLGVMPLDHLGGAPARLMAVAEGDDCPEPTVWGLYSRCLDAAGCREEQFEMLDRDAFYEAAEGAYAVVQTGETALYGNIILRKGVVRR